MTGEQRRTVLDLLHGSRFAGQAPAEIHATLLDEGLDRCSIRAMYRLLDANGEVRERRRRLRHPVYRKPELLAEKPNEVWSWATALLPADPGVARSHNRPHTSNDNPFSESQFETLKYQPRFPKRFGCIEDARSFRREFFTRYNQDRHHAGIGPMTPDRVHYRQIDAVHAARQRTLGRAFAENRERFVNKAPTPPDKPAAARINPPTPKRRA